MIKDLAFRCLYGFRGYPRMVGTTLFRFDESLRRWDFEGEKEVRDAMTSEIQAGDLAVDVGANFGMHTLIMADRVGQQGRVIAIEPIPANLRLLERNLRLNRFDDRVQVIASAISNVDSNTLTMTLNSDVLEPSASIFPSALVACSSTIRQVEVASQTLDSVLVQLEPDRKCFIKIDVEGAELSVLRSAIQTLAKWHPTLLIEVHDYALPSFGESTETVYAFLANHGFQVEQISDMRNHNGQYHHILARPAVQSSLT